MGDTPGSIAGLQDHRDFRLAVPTPDHFIPLLYLAGLADAAGTATDVLVDGYAYGSLSMIAYTLGGPGTGAHRAVDRGGAAPLPDPARVPPDDTNL
jgi:4,5-DOPA dioxygenase extradiol